jgi:cytochrome P450
MEITLTNVLLGLILGLLANAVYAAIRSHLGHLPGPWWSRSTVLSLFQAIPRLVAGKRHMFYTELLQEYAGKTGIVRSAPDTLLVADSAIAAAGLATANGWPKDPALYRGDDEDATRNLFSHVDADAHKDLRRKISPAFSIKSLNSFEPIIASVIGDFLERLDHMAVSRQKDDFVKLYGLFTGDIIGSVAFGDDWGLVKTGHLTF